MSRESLKNLPGRFYAIALGALMLAFALVAGAAALPSAAFADGLANGTYSIPGLTAEVFHMYHFDEQGAYVVVRGDDAWLVTETSDESTTKRYAAMAYGPQSEILDPADSTNHTLISGTPIAEGIINYAEDGVTMKSRTFVLPVPKGVLESGDDIYYMVRYSDKYSASHDGDWYAAGGGDYYFSGYTLEYVSDSTLLPGETPLPDEDYIELDVVNDADGLTADDASMAIEEDGSADLTVDLEGASADYMFLGTLAQALAAGDDLSAWIADEAREDGTTRFVIPTAYNATLLPFAVVGADDIDDIAEKLHAYQFELDLAAATLTLERYDNAFDIAVEVAEGVKPEFSTASTASVRAIGDPNDSMFKCVVTLPMNDEAYDYIEYTSMVEGELAPAGASLSDGSFLLVFENSAGQKSFSLGEPISLSVHHVDSDVWLDRTLTLDLADGVIRIDGTDDSEDVVKALIEALPRDPIDIRNDDDGAIAKAAAAYDALPADAKARLDGEPPPLSTTSYGRILQNAQWAVDALSNTDASSTLPEGVYTSGIESTYDYGKTPSTRTKAIKVKSITVKDGVAVATLEHESTTDGIMHINGREYANNPPVSNKDYRTYDVPIDLNSTTHLVWKAQDAGSGTTGTSVELTNSIDESRTSPDSPLPSGDDTSSEEYEAVINELLDIIDQLQGQGSSAAPAANPNASTASNSSALAAAAASRTGNTTKATTTGAASPTAQASLGKGSLGSNGLGFTGESMGNDDSTGNAPLAILAGILCAAALGALGFALRFVHREDKK